MLVGELSTEVGYAARLRRIKVKLEPLVAKTVVVDLKAPSAVSILVPKLPMVSSVKSVPH